MKRVKAAGMCVLALVVGLTACGGAWAGVQKVAVSGENTPGYTGSTFMQMFGNLWLNESGQVGFFCDVMNGGMPSGGIFLYDSAVGSAIVLNNGFAPGGSTFMLGSMNGYAMNDAGQIVFGADVSFGASGLFRGDAAGITPLIRMGDLAPGTNGGTVGMVSTMSQPAFNALGQTAAAVMIMGGTAMSAIYRADGMSLTPVAVEGQTAPETGGATFFNLTMSSPALGASGNVAFTSGLTGAPAGHESGLFIQNGGALALLAQQGNVAPGAVGATFGPFGAMPGGAIVMAGNDKVAARVDLMGGSANQGIFLWSGGSASPVALQNQAVPEGNGTFDMLGRPAINNAGQVAFHAILAGSANPPQDSEGIYRWTGGTLATMARKGNPSPDGNGSFASLGGPAIASTGQVAFEADLTQTAGAGADDRGIFISDGIDIVKVARKGDSLPGLENYNNHWASAATAVHLSSNMFADAQSSDTINAYGQVAFKATWTWYVYGSLAEEPGAGVFLFTPELSWRSAAGGSWDSSANWTLGLTPAYVHPVTIDPTTSLTVTGPSGAVTVDSLRVAAHGGGAAVLDLVAGGSLTVNQGITVDGGGTLRLASGSLQTAGELALNTGGTYDGAGGSLTVGSRINVNGGTLRLASGTLHSPQLNLNAGSTLDIAGGMLDAASIFQNGGTVTGTLLNTGQFQYNGGIFLGRLVNKGQVNLNNTSFTAGNGMENDSQFNLFPNQTVTLDGAGLDNQGRFNIIGGTLTGSGPLTNNGFMESGSNESGDNQPIRIAGTGGFVNNGFFDNGGDNGSADVFLTNTGSNVNNGQMEVSYATLHLDGGAALTNHGCLGVDGAIAGAGALTNAVDGTIGAVDSTGIISTPFSNAGQVVISGGVLRIQQAFTNGGTISLTGDVALLQGGAINNTGEIQGAGFITNNVTNSGIIEPMGGTLVMSGGFINTPTGRVNAATGAKVRVTSLSGPNTGIISLEGGTVEFTQSLTNAAGGLISGRGTLNVGGAGLVNNGNIGFSGGFADVYGDVANNAGAKIVISGGSTATFYDDVNAAGGEMRVSSGCSVVFFGTYNGSTTGTGTTYIEDDLRPGHSPAAVSFEGDLVLGSGAHLVAELAGTTPGSQYDQVGVGGLASLDGTLDVVLLGGFTPACGDTFDLFDFGAFDGSFDAVNLPELGGGLSWDASGLYSTGQLGVVPEPATLALVGLGLAASLLRRKRG